MTVYTSKTTSHVGSPSVHKDGAGRSHALCGNHAQGRETREEEEKNQQVVLAQERILQTMFDSLFIIGSKDGEGWHDNLENTR